MSGWIKIQRKIKDHWLYTEKRVFSKFEAWNDILLTVNFAEAQTCIKGKIYDVKRGESLLSFDSWGKRWGWDKSKVRRFLILLQNENMIEFKTDNITTHLTVCKYETYQDFGNTDETQMKRKRNTDENQMQPIKEEKEEYSIDFKKSNSPKINNIDERILTFAETLKPFLEKYGRDTVTDFYRYWTEKNKSGTKFKQELEKTWNLQLRLETWSKNELKFGSKKQQNPIDPKNPKNLPVMY